MWVDNDQIAGARAEGFALLYKQFGVFRGSEGNSGLHYAILLIVWVIVD